MVRYFNQDVGFVIGFSQFGQAGQAQKLVERFQAFDFVTLMGVAVLFALLPANFFSVVQVLVYIGAIAILILFGVMLTRRSMVDAGESLVHKNWWVVAVGVGADGCEG